MNIGECRKKYRNHLWRDAKTFEFYCNTCDITITTLRQAKNCKNTECPKLEKVAYCARCHIMCVGERKWRNWVPPGGFK